MDIKEMNIDGHDIKFVNNTWETRYAWGHETTLYIDGEKINTSKCRYYNRTWECYQYQSIMKISLYNYMERVKACFIDKYKIEHNIKRLCGNEKADCLQLLEDFEQYKMLKNAYKSL